MKRLIVSAATVVVLASAVASGQSQTVRIAFDEGKVTLAAADVPLADVLSAWATVGGTVITGVENIQGVRVSVNVKAQSELTVLDELLGGSGGYLTGMRSEVAAGASMLRLVQIAKRSNLQESRRVGTPVKVEPTAPESQFQYADPTPEGFQDPRETAKENPQTEGPGPRPELQFQYADVPLPLPAEPEAEPQETPAPDPTPAPKKKPPQER